jgi:hypothetical protein
MGWHISKMIKWQMMFDKLDAGNNDQVSLDHVQNEDDTEHNNDKRKTMKWESKFWGKRRGKHSA